MTATEPSPEILKKLEEAVARRLSRERAEVIQDAPQPSPPKQPTLRDGAEPLEVGAAGNAVTKQFFIDHYFGYPYGDLWMYDGTKWHGFGSLTAQDEQGAMQVAFASNRVEVSWSDNDNITSMRCWKFLT